MVLSSAPATVSQSGMVVATGLPAQVKTPVSNIPGGLLNAAVAKTGAAIAEQSAHAKAAGATMRGGAVVTVPQVPEGGTTPGISFAKNHANLTGIANQLKAGAVYDGLIGSQPYKVGGGKHTKVPYTRNRSYRRHLPSEEPAMSAGRKHRRKTKKNVRRRRNGSSRRVQRKRLHMHRRTNRRVHKLRR